MEKKITSKDIARLAGVSQSTVSRALNPDTSWRISPQKREEIRRLCKEHGVMPSRSVKKYAFERTRRIGFILGAMEMDLHDMGNSALIRNICDILQTSGYTLELIRLDYSAEKKVKHLRQILNSGMADVYVVGAGLLNGQSLELLHRNSARLILTLSEEMSSNPYPDHHWLSYFIYRTEEASQAAYDFIPPEHRGKIIYFGRDNRSSALKIKRLKRIMALRGDDPDRLEIFLYGKNMKIFSDNACRVAGRFVRENIEKFLPVTAFWCGGFSSCMLYDELLLHGKVPDRDFTLISQGQNSKLLIPPVPGIHTIARDVDLAAEKLCEQIFQLIDDPQPRKVFFHYDFNACPYDMPENL